MDTPKLIYRCGWRFYAGRFLNTARFGTGWAPYAATMAIKGFYELRISGAMSPETIRSMLASTIRRAYPRFSWRFGRDRYEPQYFAYGSDSRLHPFDHENQLSISEVKTPHGTFWGFVEQQCELDETEPQLFGEVIRLRYAVSGNKSIFVRVTFNHALVDGLQIFRFLTAWEKSVGRSGHELISIDLNGKEDLRRWRTRHTEYTVEDLYCDGAEASVRHGSGYHSILYEIATRSRYARIRQAVATPRNAQVQLALAPVSRVRNYETFLKKNENVIRRAQSGTAFSRLLDLYRRFPDIGDAITRGLMTDPLIGRKLLTALAGDLLVSAFMFRHKFCLAFPVVHATQREGAAICNIWNTEKGSVVRITRARRLGRIRPGKEIR